MLPDIFISLLPWALGAAGLFVLVLWISLVIWTARDIRSRSIRGAARFFAPLWVLLTFLPGWLIYLVLRPRRTLEAEYMSHLQEEALLQGLQGRTLCPVCQKIVQAEWLACPHCLTLLRKRCSACGKAVEAEWSLCPHCTAQLPQAEAAGLPLA